MVPFMCGNLTCKDRQRVVLSEDGTIKQQKKKDGDESVSLHGRLLASDTTAKSAALINAPARMAEVCKPVRIGA